MLTSRLSTRHYKATTGHVASLVFSAAWLGFLTVVTWASNVTQLDGDATATIQDSSMWYSNYNPSTIATPITQTDINAAKAVGLSILYPKMVKEFELVRKTLTDPNTLLIHALQKNGTMGFVAAIAVRAPFEILVVHRGYGRCCNAWCGGNLVSCGMQPPIPSPILYWFKDGVVIGTYAKGFFRFPHAIGQDPDGQHAWVTDHIYDQAFKIDLVTGEIVMALGWYWSKPLVGVAYPATADGKQYYFSRLRNQENPGMLCMPTSVGISKAYGLAFVGSGYCDHVVWVYNTTNAQPLYAISHPLVDTSIKFQIPHDVLVDDAKQQIVVANREFGTVDIFSFAGEYIASWDVRPYGMGRPFSIKRYGSSRLLVNFDDQSNPLSGSLGELDINNPGLFLKAYAVPMGSFPQHYMDFWEDEDGALHIYIASPIPEYYIMPGNPHEAEGQSTEEVGQMIFMQYVGVIVGTLTVPVIYLLYVLWHKCQNLSVYKPSKYVALEDEVEMANNHSNRSPQVGDSQEPLSVARSLAKDPKYKGVMFVCSGEDTIQMTSAYASIIDTSLTPLGEQAAKAVGRGMKSKRTLFDYVYCSHLRRAAYTAVLALRNSAQSDLEGSIILDRRLADRSYGIFAGQSIVLMIRCLGYGEFWGMMHSPRRPPPLGESIQSVYHRVVEFFKNEVEPKIADGKKVLVVSHQCPLEVMAMYLAGVGPEDYHYTTLPTGKAITLNELVKCYKVAQKAKLRNDFLGRLASVPAAPYVFIAMFVVRLGMDSPLWPPFVSKLMIAFGLAGITLLGLLDIDFVYAFKNCPQKGAFMVFYQIVVRVVVASVVLAVRHNSAVLDPLLTTSNPQTRAYMACMAALWIMPPPSTLASVSATTGGSIFLSVVSILILCTLLPLLCIVYVILNWIPTGMLTLGDLHFFFVLYAAFLVPTVVAFIINRSRVLQMRHFTPNRSSIVAGLFWLMMVAAVQLYTPATIRKSLGFNTASFLMPPAVVAPLPLEKRYDRIIMMTAVQAAVLSIANIVLMRLTAWVSAYTLTRWSDRSFGGSGPSLESCGCKIDAAKQGEMEHKEVMTQKKQSKRMQSALDCYITLAVPNIFMYAALLQGVREVQHLPIGEYMVFFTMLFFCAVQMIEINYGQNLFMSRLLQKSLRAGYDDADQEAIKKLWKDFKNPRTHSYHPEKLVHNLVQLNSEGEQGVPGLTSMDRRLHEYTADGVKNMLSTLQSVDFAEFEAYLRQSNCVLNLNPTTVKDFNKFVSALADFSCQSGIPPDAIADVLSAEIRAGQVTAHSSSSSTRALLRLASGATHTTSSQDLPTASVDAGGRINLGVYGGGAGALAAMNADGVVTSVAMPSLGASTSGAGLKSVHGTLDSLIEITEQGSEEHPSSKN